jgi:mRNA-degrading endonuclease RelE of RelBE toxin-antitoxin system
MIRYTVTYTREARDQLASLWLDAPARSSVSAASNTIDQVLAEDASTKGDQGVEGFRRLIILPLVVQFTVEEDDRTVTVWSVNRIPS